MSTRKIDVEVVENVLKELIQEKLPAKITEINLDKGDNLLEEIPTTNYFADLYSQELTASLFVFYGITESDVQSIGGDSATTWSFFFYVAVSELNFSKTARPKVMRYTRAFYEIINENSDKLSKYGSIPQISNLTPQSVRDINNQTPYKIGGIDLKITIG